MPSEIWKKLQNGSDIRGVALEGVAGQNVNLTPEIAEKIARAFGAWLSARLGRPLSELKVSIGHDSRLSAEALRSAAVTGLSSAGVQVVSFGLCSTPAMFMSTQLEPVCADGAIMLTASHLPFNRNGLKFFTKDGGLEKADITAILDLAEAGITVADQTGPVTSFDFLSVYAANLVRQIREGVNHPEHFETPLKGFRVLVDAGNGAGGFFADQVLIPLGADITGSQFLDPDGSFPNHVPNPEDEAAMASARQAVLSNRADLGIIFDTDVDRAGAVDAAGGEINRNRLIALMAAIALETYPGATIVTDSITSRGLRNFIEGSLGGRHHRFKRGYKNVINEAIRLTKSGETAPLAIETSGHGALMDNYFLDDGAYMAVRMLIAMAKMSLSGKKLTDLVSGLEEPLESREFRLSILPDDFRSCGEQVIAELSAYAAAQDGWAVESPNFEGIRVNFDKDHGNGWFLLRLSLHDPLLPLNIESDAPGGVKTIAEGLLTFLSAYDTLDLNPLKTFIHP